MPGAGKCPSKNPIFRDSHSVTLQPVLIAYTSLMSDTLFSYTTAPGSKDGTTVLKITGPLTLASIFDFQNEFRQMKPQLLIVDLTECPYMDSARARLDDESVRLCRGRSPAIPAGRCKRANRVSLRANQGIFDPEEISHRGSSRSECFVARSHKDPRCPSVQGRLCAADQPPGCNRYEYLPTAVCPGTII